MDQARMVWWCSINKSLTYLDECNETKDMFKQDMVRQVLTVKEDMKILACPEVRKKWRKKIETTSICQTDWSETILKSLNFSSFLSKKITYQNTHNNELTAWSSWGLPMRPLIFHQLFVWRKSSDWQRSTHAPTRNSLTLAADSETE